MSKDNTTRRRDQARRLAVVVGCGYQTAFDFLRDNDLPSPIDSGESIEALRGAAEAFRMAEKVAWAKNPQRPSPHELRDLSAADLAVALVLVRAFVDEGLERGDSDLADASTACWAFATPEDLDDMYGRVDDDRSLRGAYDSWFVEAFALIDVPEVRTLREWDASLLRIVLDVVYWLIASMEDQMHDDRAYFEETAEEYLDDFDRLLAIAEGDADIDDLKWLAEEHVTTRVIPRAQFRAGYLTNPYNHLDSWVPTVDLARVRRRVAIELWWSLRRCAEMWTQASIDDDMLLGSLSHGLAADGERLTRDVARRIADAVVDLMGRLEIDQDLVQSSLDHHLLLAARQDVVERLASGVNTVPHEVLEVVGGIRPSQAEIDRTIDALIKDSEAPAGVLSDRWFDGWTNDR